MSEIKSMHYKLKDWPHGIANVFFKLNWINWKSFLTPMQNMLWFWYAKSSFKTHEQIINFYRFKTKNITQFCRFFTDEADFQVNRMMRTLGERSVIHNLWVYQVIWNRNDLDFIILTLDNVLVIGRLIFVSGHHYLDVQLR